MSKFRTISRFEKLEREEILNPSLGLAPVSNYNQKAQPSHPMAENDQTQSGRKAASRAAALADTHSKMQKILREDEGLRSSENRRAFYDLNIRHDALRQLLSTATDPLGPQVKRLVSAPAPRPRVKPMSMGVPNTKYGTAGRLSGFTSVAGNPQYRRKSQLVPCIERGVRRAVLFAMWGGVGHKSPHKRKPSSSVPC